MSVMAPPIDLRISRFVMSSKFCFVTWLIAHAVTMFGIGAVLAGSEALPARSSRWLIPLAVLLPLIFLRAKVLSRLPSLVRQARWMLMRPLIVWEFTGWVSLIVGLGSTLPMIWAGLLASTGAVAALGLALGLASSEPIRFPVVEHGFFLWTRGHFDDWSARRHVVTHVIFAGLTAANLLVMLRSSPVEPSGSVPQRVTLFFTAAAVAMLVPLLQVNPQRGICFIHFGTLGLLVATTAHGIDPLASWPTAVLGAAFALPFPGLSTALLMHVAPRQRFAAVAIAEGLALVAALATSVVAWLPGEAARWFLVTAAVCAFGALLRLYFRECVEIVMEILFWPMYRFHVVGPGLTEVPWRGPVLVIANHAAFFDPLFLGKYLPLRLRALMISTMFDKPFLKWLAGDVYGAIRVPDRPGFRRTMPELDEAVAVLKNGENLIIFPEGWLRRREDTPLHRFAQGIHRILLQMPNTPVLPCWIETSWGSYLSYKNGPPGKNKPFDWFYKIVIAYGPPEIVPPEMLTDHKTARRYLMERVLQARTYLGLPAHPVPGLTSVEPEFAESTTNANDVNPTPPQS